MLFFGEINWQEKEARINSWPQETQEYFDKDGFGHTGDLGFYNDEGFVVYVDRMKDLIKYNNMHVAPMEIENLLQKHEAVIDCVVYGTKDPNVQELISAVVVKNPKINVSKITGEKSKKTTDEEKILGKGHK